MIKIITSTGPTYEETMHMHEQRLNNLEMYGRVQTNAEMAAQTKNLEAPRQFKIHGVYPTIYNYGNRVMYTTVVCFEPVEEEKEEEKEREYGMPIMARIS